LLSLVAWAGDPSGPLDWAPGHLGTVSPRFYPLVATAPEGVKVPSDIADGRFGVLDLAGGVRVAVAHEAGGKARGLWVDADLDGDLAEETPVPWSAGENWPSTTDTVRLPTPGAAEPRSVLLLFKRERSDVHDQLGVITRAHRRGWIEVSSRLRPAALVDGNGDLRFDDLEHDRAFLDLDGDGEIQTSYEEIRLGEAVAVGREGYAVEVPDPLGGTVTFRRVPKAPAPRPWLVPPVPPPIQHTGPPPVEPFAEFAARFDPRTNLLVAARYGTPESFRLLLQGCSAEAVQQMATRVRRAGDEVARLRVRIPCARRRAARRALRDARARRAKIGRSSAGEGRGGEGFVEDAARRSRIWTPRSRATLLDVFATSATICSGCKYSRGAWGATPRGRRRRSSISASRTGASGSGTRRSRGAGACATRGRGRRRSRSSRRRTT
jgi:hypothetical protein